MKIIITYSLFVLSLAALKGTDCQTANAGVKVLLTQQAMNYAAGQAVEILASKVTNARIDDAKGNTKVKVGKVDYEITNVAIESFTRPSSTVVVNEGQGMTLSLNGASVSCKGNWRYKFKKGFIRVRDSGSFTASAADISISVAVRFDVSHQSAPTIAVISCSSHVKDADFKLKGGASWLYNIFLKFYKNKISRSIENMMCKEIQKTINENAARELSTLNLRATINNFLTLDYSLVGSPIFANQVMESSHVGRFLNDDVIESAPTMHSAASRMVNVMISDVTLNSASRLFFKNNKLNLVKEFSGDAIASMVASVLSDVDIQLQGTRLALSIGATSAPVVSVTPGGISMKAEVEGKFDIVTEDNTRSNVLTFRMSVEFQISVSIRDEKVIGSVATFTPSLTYCSIPGVNLEKINNVLNGVINEVVPLVNLSLQSGMPLPSVEGIRFPDATIQLNQRYFVVATDVVYQP